MKSCLGILLAIAILVSLVGGLAMVWYLSSSTEFSRGSVEATGEIPPPVPGKPQAPR